MDAPGGSLAWLELQAEPVDFLLLTHSHFDHVEEAAQVAERNGCAVGYHPWTTDMAREAEIFRSFGLQISVRHVAATRSLEEGVGQELLGEPMDILHVPGHHPASICVYFPRRGELYAGDTLFAGSIGRTDLPGGDHELLLRGIREKLYTLPDDTQVFPGHGPATTIGQEKRTNPFVRP